MNESEKIDYYLNNKGKGLSLIAEELSLSKSGLKSLIYRNIVNRTPLNKDIESRIIGLSKIYPYTGTVAKISKELGISTQSVRQCFMKTKNKELIEFKNKPKSSCFKLDDEDIKSILENSKNGIGNDLMGKFLGIDGISIRNIRKRYLTKEEYEQYHSVNRFYEGDYNSYYNDRGDKLLSTWEGRVADYLYFLGVAYESNVMTLCKERRHSPDFLLKDSGAFIEVYGMSNVPSYKTRMKKKVKFYLDNNIKCLSLLEEDFIIKSKNVMVDIFKTKIDSYLLEIRESKFNKNVIIL